MGAFWRRARADHARPAPFVGRSEGESDIIETESRPDAWAAYCADGAEAAGMGRDPMYCQELGLAIETPRDGSDSAAAVEHIVTLWQLGAFCPQVKSNGG